MLLLPWEWDAPCHTHGCYGRIRWKIVPAELKDVAAAVIAGICDDCKRSLIASGQAEEVQAASIDWPEVDKFLREHRNDDRALPLVEGALGVRLAEQPKRRRKGE